MIILSLMMALIMIMIVNSSSFDYVAVSAIVGDPNQ